MFRVDASIRHETEIGPARRPLPPFYVEGAGADTAVETARQIIDPFGKLESNLSLMAVPVQLGEPIAYGDPTQPPGEADA